MSTYVSFCFNFFFFKFGQHYLLKACNYLFCLCLCNKRIDNLIKSESINKIFEHKIMSIKKENVARAAV